VLWRHGRTRWNVEDRFQGHSDIELDDLGVAQATSAAQVLATLRPSAIVSSDLRRASATAGQLAALVGLQVVLDPRLRETNGGAWEGRTSREIAAADADAYARWRSGADVPAGGAETRSDVADRAQAALDDALRDLPDGAVLVAVTHGGTARAAIGRLLGLPPQQWRVLGGLANACWSVLSGGVEGGWRLTEHNAGSLPQPVVGDDR
jgi:glucosyl-3-phosphoglycerate phosphatase